MFVYACTLTLCSDMEKHSQSVSDTEKHVCGQMISILVTDVLKLLWQSIRTGIITGDQNNNYKMDSSGSKL